MSRGIYRAFFPPIPDPLDKKVKQVNEVKEVEQTRENEREGTADLSTEETIETHQLPERNHEKVEKKMVKDDKRWKRLKMSNVGLYSMTKPWMSLIITHHIIRTLHKIQTNSNESENEDIELDNIEGKNGRWRVVDAQASVGGLTLSLSLSKAFCRIVACDIVPLHCSILRNNLDVYHIRHSSQVKSETKSKSKSDDDDDDDESGSDIDDIESGNGNGNVQVEVKCRDYLKVMVDDSEGVDAVFFDPPWGGTQYRTQQNIRLGLNNLNIGCVIGELLLLNKNKGRLKVICLLVPYNYDFDNFTQILNVHFPTIRCDIETIPLHNPRKQKQQKDVDNNNSNNSNNGMNVNSTDHYLISITPKQM